MNPRQDEIDALARAIDRVVFHDPATGEDRAPSAALAVISHLNDSFPRMAVAGSRHQRLQRKLIRALRIPPPQPVGNLARIEAEMNRRLAGVDPRWRPVVGGAALVLLGVVGVAVWRQRGATRPAIVALR